MNSSQMMALMPMLMLSLTAVALMIQASIKRDQAVAWWITGVGFLLALWGAGYAREFAQPVTLLLVVDDWGPRRNGCDGAVLLTESQCAAV